MHSNRATGDPGVGSAPKPKNVKIRGPGNGSAIVVYGWRKCIPSERVFFIRGVGCHEEGTTYILQQSSCPRNMTPRVPAEARTFALRFRKRWPCNRKTSRYSAPILKTIGQQN